MNDNPELADLRDTGAQDDEFKRALRHTEDVINNNFRDLFARVKALEERFDRLEADLSEMVRRRFE